MAPVPDLPAQTDRTDVSAGYNPDFTDRCFPPNSKLPAAMQIVPEASS